MKRLPNLFIALFACIIPPLLMMAGCGSLGARAMKKERVNLNVALQQTGDEQLLLNLVRLRYRDTPAFLEVSSISTQSTFEASLEGGAELERNEVDTDIFSFIGTAGFSTQPTLTYTPLQGENFIQRLLTPLSLEKLMLLHQTGWNIRRVFRLCVQRLNDVKNAPRASGPTPEGIPEYKDYLRVLELLRDLEQRDDSLSIVYETDPSNETSPRMVMQIKPEALQYAETEELVNLLGLTPGKIHYPFNFPSTQHGQPPNSDFIRVETRSFLGMLYYLSHAVKVSEHDLQKGKVTVTKDESGKPFDWKAVLGDSMNIVSQETVPSEASVAVYYRGKWFFIDDTDLESKSTFSLLYQIFALQAGKAEGILPILTLPVGK
ncbi:MAG: hypothetical protein ACD_75C00608G0003 [uncultured bacterium]|nr:MAG: hypothetical protein ACD_75C00608G0003 [uncultured bacterium]HBG19770.1 hypothetical protein [Desulfobulbaceae bacterium]